MSFNLFKTALLALEADGTYTPFSGDAWLEAGQMTLLGMAMVFAVLAILWAVLAIFKLVFAGRTPKEPKVKSSKKKATAVGADDDVIAAVIAASIQAIQEDEARNNTALVAVLTAAIAAHRDAEGAQGEFRVVSFKRMGNGRGWNTRK